VKTNLLQLRKLSSFLVSARHITYGLPELKPVS